MKLPWFKGKEPIDIGAYGDYLIESLAVLESWSAELMGLKRGDKRIRNLDRTVVRVRTVASDGQDIQPPKSLRRVHKTLLQMLNAIDWFFAAHSAYADILEAENSWDDVVRVGMQTADEASSALLEYAEAFDVALDAAVESGDLEDQRIVGAAERLFGWY